MSNNVKLVSPSPEKFPDVFQISPLIRITLLSLYLALTVPLPFLAQVTGAPVSPKLLGIGIAIGWIVVYGVLSERVMVTQDKIEVGYPRWVSLFLRKGWSLSWTEIKALKLRTTGQGGLVYYFVTLEGDRAYLLPMRIVGFARLLKLVEEKTGLDTTDIRPLAQPWMYLILLVFTLFLFLIDGWTIMTALSINN